MQNEVRLIDANALQLEADQHNVMNGVAFVGQRGGGRTLEIVKRLLKHMIDNAPTIDAEPVRNGRWVWFENRPVTDADDPECIGCTGYECSECGNNEGTCIRFYEELSPDMLARIKEGLMEFLTNYCPNCGAKMDAEER